MNDNALRELAVLDGEQLAELWSEIDALRQLLWQALEDERSNISDHGPEWRERAEKALKGTT